MSLAEDSYELVLMSYLRPPRDGRDGFVLHSYPVAALAFEMGELSR